MAQIRIKDKKAIEPEKATLGNYNQVYREQAGGNPQTKTILGGYESAPMVMKDTSLLFDINGVPVQSYGTGYGYERDRRTGEMNPDILYALHENGLRNPLPSDDPINAEKERLAALWQQYMQGYQGYQSPY